MRFYWVQKYIFVFRIVQKNKSITKYLFVRFLKINHLLIYKKYLPLRKQKKQQIIVKKMNLIQKSGVACLAALMFTGSCFESKAQVTINLGELSNQLNTITTGVPFLMIAPDSRQGGMGEAGAATIADANSLHWNAAKLPFAKEGLGVSVSYTPWLRKLVPDISLSYLSFYKKIDDVQAFGASLRYFSLGDITFTDITGATTGTFNPNEFAVDAAYARKLSDEFSASVTGRFIYSNLASGFGSGADVSRAGITGAADIGLYYEKEILLGVSDATLAFGANISNIGAKIAYSSSGQDNFLPCNMRLGSRLTIDLDEYNSLSITADANKLLVPTNPVYDRDTITGRVLVNPDGSYKILSGQDPFAKNVIEGIFSSFGDAPGGGKEELREINYAAGLEYWYDKQFALRGGYFHESQTKGGRQFFTLGTGLKYNVFNINFAYLIPFANRAGGVQQVSPLQNTLRFSLQFDLEAFR